MLLVGHPTGAAPAGGGMIHDGQLHGDKVLPDGQGRGRMVVLHHGAIGARGTVHALAGLGRVKRL